jgi:hypothetical protein
VLQSIDVISSLTARSTSKSRRRRSAIGNVAKGDVDLVVVPERAVVEVRGPDDRPGPVHHQRLGVHHRRPILEQPYAGFEEARGTRPDWRAAPAADRYVAPARVRDRGHTVGPLGRGPAELRQRFAGASDVVGRQLTVQRVPFIVVGVMPPGFFGPDVGRMTDVMLPFAAEPLIRGQESRLANRGSWWLQIMVRLKPAQGIEQANAALRVAPPQIIEGATRDLSEPLTRAPAAPGNSSLRRRFETPLFAMVVAVGLVLLVACAGHRHLAVHCLIDVSATDAGAAPESRVEDLNVRHGGHPFTR